LRVVALFVADQHHAAVAEPGKAADDRLVLAKQAIPAQRHEPVNIRST
jgi:hypothetical protein